MTEYATTPSAIEEWNAQRSRTRKWVEEIPPPQICYTPSQSPSQDSDFENRSLWDGSGWEVESDCESSTSCPPTMMLKYSDTRQVLISPSQENGSRVTPSGSKFRKKSVRDESVDSAATTKSRSHPVTSAVTSAPVKTSTRQSSRAASTQPVNAKPASNKEVQPSQAPTVQDSKRSSIHAPEPSSSHLQPKHVSDPTSSDHAGPSSPANPSQHVASQVPSHSRSRSRSPSIPVSQIRSQPSRPPTTASHPSHRPSVAPLIASRPPSHEPSRPPSHHPSHELSHSHVTSHRPSHAPSQTVAPSRHASEAPPVVHDPTPSSSIHSRSISHTESRSSGPPEAITVHPPTVSASHQSVPSSRMPYPHSAMTSQSVPPPAANVALPPPTAGSASLSYRPYYPSGDPHPSAHIQPSIQSSRASRYHSPNPPPKLHTKGVQVDTLPQYVLPTPVSLDEPRYPSHPGRVMSNMSSTGLDGGYILVDGEDASEEQYPAPKKGSFGRRSGHERSNIFNVFGAGSRFGHSRSRSAGQSNSNSPNENAVPTSTPLEPIPGSPPPATNIPLTHRSHHSEQIHNAAAYAYPTPVSPTNPGSFSNHHDTEQGPHPPSIVYAPARHGRTTQFSPPRIMYMPASPQHGVDHSPARSVRRARTGPLEGSTGVRDSGFSMTSGPRLHAHQHHPTVVRDFAGTGDVNYAQTVAEMNPQAKLTYGHENVLVNPGPPPAPATVHLASPPRSQLSHLDRTNSDATSARTNIAGVGTHLNVRRDRTRSRSHPRGIIFSASAPQPSSGTVPHAAMMMPPSQERERGLRDTPYPTPPGSANEHLSPAAVITAASQTMPHRTPRKHRPASARSVPIYANIPPEPPVSEATVAYDPRSDTRLSTKGLMSRFRDIYHGGDYLEGDPVLDESKRGRARERRQHHDHDYTRHTHMDTRRPKERRAGSVGSEDSTSSASTYYVISNPGQKVRIIVSRNNFCK